MDGLVKLIQKLQYDLIEKNYVFMYNISMNQYVCFHKFI